MKNFYKTILIALAIFSFSTNVNATHLSGLDFSYECVGQDSFLVTFNIFRDCSGVAAPSSAFINFVNTCGGSITLTLVLQNPGGTEVSQLCSSSIMNSTCNGGSLPGMHHYIYSGVVVLNPPCSTWEMNWSSCCRNTTLNVTGQPGSFIKASINTTDFPCNNSPKFAESYIRYVHLGQLVSHSFTVTEPDGDSLTYHFTEPLSGTSTSVPFNTGYTYQQPIPGITLDTTSGLIQFTPLALGNYIVAVKVCEYEFGTGILKGCVTRDIEYVVINSSNNNVQADTITNNQANGTVVGPYDIELCLGDSLSFDIIFSDPDVGDSIFITSNLASILPGASITTTGGNPDTVSVNWLSQGVLGSTNTFIINAIDNGCAVYSSISIPVNIHILENTYAGLDQIICAGSQWVTIPTTGGTLFNWSVLSGSPIDTNSSSPTYNMTCANCQNPQVSPQVTTTYVVNSNLQNSCKSSDTVTIQVVTQFDAGFNTQSPYCINGTLDTFLPNVSNGVFTGNGINSLGVFDPSIAGIGIWPINYSITSPFACANDSTMNIEVLALPDASIQYQEVCFGGSPIFLTPVNSGGIFSGLGITDSVNGVFDVTGLSAGTYNITYTLTQPCFNSQITGIKVIEPYTFSFNNNIIEICNNEQAIDLSNNIILSNDPNQGSGPIKEYWSDFNGYVDSTGLFDPTLATPGDYIMTLAISDSNGTCGSSKTMVVRVLQVDYHVINSSLTYCASDGVVLIDVMPVLNGFVSDLIVTPIPPLSPSDTLSVSLTGTGATFNTTILGTGSWEVTFYLDNNNCTGEVTDTIYVLPVPVNDSVIQNQTVLTAALGGGYDYQWLDCNNNMAPVPGATNQSFTPAVTGDYAVKISAGNCSITSGCYYGWSVGVEKVENELGISIFPNPTKDAIQIDRGDNKKVEIQIIDFTGKLIWRQSLQNPVTTIDLNSYANGVYIIKMNTENGSSTQRIIKQ